jgi:hypothetical protein
MGTAAELMMKSQFEKEILGPPQQMGFDEFK